MSGLELIVAATSLASGALGLAGSAHAGKSAQAAADFEAIQLEMKAKEETAAAQRDALANRREGELVNSRALALAAASGAGAGSDAPTIVKLIADTSAEAEYNARSSMYGGLSRAAGLRDSAKGRRLSGKAVLTGSVFEGLGSFGKGLSGALGAFN